MVRKSTTGSVRFRSFRRRSKARRFETNAWPSLRVSKRGCHTANRFLETRYNSFISAGQTNEIHTLFVGCCFRRNEAANGGAIVNSALISFVADDKLVAADNVATGEVRRPSNFKKPQTQR